VGEVWNESASRLTKSRYEAVPHQGEHAEKCEAFVVKDGGVDLAVGGRKIAFFTWEICLMPERVTVICRSKKSA